MPVCHNNKFPSHISALPSDPVKRARKKSAPKRNKINRITENQSAQRYLCIALPNPQTKYKEWIIQTKSVP